ncbi:hypothetical protein EUGRSUZ_I01471 [Eucalyptus grandis]|uniref:Uncharacterized protein n=2 Tax=Eucalyptus grandis TaxID=71139 RepID=A0ACC3JFB6_EUCGR|nr:hypothetical protein EUGRSUZ_I01471 [Eucalyptus grandis]
MIKLSHGKVLSRLEIRTTKRGLKAFVSLAFLRLDMKKIDYNKIAISPKIKHPLGAKAGRSGLSSHSEEKMASSPLSIKHTPYGSPFATPYFCSSSISRNPGRTAPSTNGKNHKKHDEKPAAAEFEEVWSYAGNISARRASGYVPERD